MTTRSPQTAPAGRTLGALPGPRAGRNTPPGDMPLLRTVEKTRRVGQLSPPHRKNVGFPLSRRGRR